MERSEHPERIPLSWEMIQQYNNVDGQRVKSFTHQSCAKNNPLRKTQETQAEKDE